VTFERLTQAKKGLEPGEWEFGSRTKFTVKLALEAGIGVRKLGEEQNSRVSRWTEFLGSHRESVAK
jgi:hypothetical protein